MRTEMLRSSAVSQQSQRQCVETSTGGTYVEVGYRWK